MYVKVYRCGLCHRLVITDEVVEDEVINDEASLIVSFFLSQPKVEKDTSRMIHHCADKGIGLVKFVGLQKRS